MSFPVLTNKASLCEHDIDGRLSVSFMYPADLQEYQLFGLGEDHLSMIVE